MNLDYESYLTNKLSQIARNVSPDTILEVATEQAWAKKKTLTPNTIYVVIKYLSAEKILNAITQPVQMLIITEQNMMETSKEIFNQFVNMYNWNAHTENSTFIKEQYSTPVVVSNFNDVQAGYRSVLYMTGSLYIMEDVVDVTDLHIDDSEYEIKPISFGLSYAMTPNTQQLKDEFIASSVKSASSFSISLSIAMQNSAILDKIIKILDETDTAESLQTTSNFGGNETFKFSFKLGETTIVKYLKLTSLQINSNPASVPSINLGFMK